MPTVTAERYSRGAIAFHWTLAALIVANLVLGIFSDAFPSGFRAMPVHKAIGVTVLVLTLGRIAWRLARPAPPLVPGLPAWERLAAHGSHGLLYAFSLAVPLTGWLMVSGTVTRRPLDWFGLFPIPYLPVGPAVGGGAHSAHVVLGLAFAGLVVLHVAAALRHHFILRNATLVRMLP